MKNQFKNLSIVALATVLLIGCGENKPSETTSSNVVTTAIPTNTVNSNEPQKGDHVPSNLVCMVNDAYMGKQQLEVPFEGKTYYGCCDMCKKRIPEDESVRYATDHVSHKQVDKADAVIAISGDNGKVSYFENKANYKAYFKK